MPRRLVPLLIVATGGAFGALLGWFLGRLLVEDAFFGGILALLTAASGLFPGLVLGAIVARFVIPERQRM